MLVVSRQVNERLTVHTPAGDYVIVITEVKGSRVLLGIEAPKDFAIERDDMKQRVKA